MPDLCACMKDVLSELNSEIEGSHVFGSDVKYVFYFVFYVL